ncbi:MAG: TonB-dependent receptor [Melioribacteraceae bacterium]|nr:TonB-dependent receptor [Melioribacteraceae bacterium]
MKKFQLIFVVLFSFLFCIATQAGTYVSGTVKDIAGSGLPGANIIVKGKFVGATTNAEGAFDLQTKLNPPFTIVVSMIGYSSQEISITDSESTIDVIMEEAIFMSNTVVVSASRTEESFLRAPVTIEKLDQLAIRQSPAVSFFDGLAEMKEIDLIANSMVFKGPTGRGFGDMHNTGLIQLIDGTDNTGIANGSFSIGNMLGISDIDVADVEFLPGASSALYGPNAFSGVLFINTKSPFTYQGISAQIKSGTSSSDYAGTFPFYEANLRYAKSYGDFAFKVVGSHFQAQDWVAHNFDDKKGRSKGNPDYDGVNIYGDEVRKEFDLDALAGTPAGTFGKQYVARTGYKEEDLYNYDPAQSSKFNAGLVYRLSENLEASYDFRIGVGRSIYQGTNRYGLDNLMVFYNKLELKGNNFFVRGYMQQEDAGDSHDIVFTGWNVNRTWKSDPQWFGEYLPVYIGSLVIGKTQAEADAAARLVADKGRLEPGSDEFNAAVEKIKGIKDFATGSGFTSKSGFSNMEAMYNFADHIDFLDLQVGGNYRFYGVNTEGTIYSDANEAINLYEYGVYAQIAKDLIDNQLRLTASLRMDDHKNFENQISPRIAVVYSPSIDHNFRASFQSGFNNPIIESQYINLNLGPIVLLGGTQDNMDRTGLHRIYENGLNITTGKFEKTPFVKPEFQETFEVGYKALISDQLFVDVNYYRSEYTNRFKTVTVLDPDLLAQGIQFPYRLYTNEQDKNIILQGTGLGLTYSFLSGYRAGINYVFVERSGGDDKDPFTSLNRPKHNVKLSFGNAHLFENFGFNLAVRWRSEFEWIATFTPDGGIVGGETVVDGQFTYKVPTLQSTIKIGVNNLMGVGYNQAFGSVEIGSMVYLSITYDSLFY